MMTPDEILRKHEDANEMHFHEVDRKFIIEAMEEYAKEKSEKPINLEGNKTAVQWLKKELKGDKLKNLYAIEELFEQAVKMEREQIIDAHYEGQCHNLEWYQKYKEKLYTSHQYFTNIYQTDL